MEIASDVGTGLDSLGQASEIPGQKINAVRVVNGSVQKKLVVAAEAVFCDVPRQAVALMEKPRAVVQHLRSHGPFQGGPGEAGIPGLLTVPYAQGGLVQTLHDGAQVKNVEYGGDGIQVEAVLDPILYGRLREFITKEW